MHGQRSVESEPLPPASPEAVLIRVFVEAFLATSSRKRATAFMRVASEILATEESVALLFPIRGGEERAAVTQAQAQALALFRQLAPTLFARIPPG